MVSTSNHSQYLCPDFLSPVASTADNGKSPLAMLAQTCQNIGAGSDSKHKDKNGNSPRNKDGERRSGSSLSAQTDENGSKSGLDKQHGRPGSAGNSGLPMPANLPASLRASMACGLIPGTLPYHQAAAAAATFGGYGMGGFGGYPFLPGFPGLGAPPASRMCVDPLCKGCTPGVPGRPCPLGCTGCNSNPAHSHAQPDLATQMLLNSSSYGSMLAAQYPGFNMSSLFGLCNPNPFLTSTAPSTSTTTSSPSTSHQETHICKWTQEDGSLCMKTFGTETELSAHVSTHAAAKPGAANNSTQNATGSHGNGFVTPKVEKLSPRERSPTERKSRNSATPTSSSSAIGPMRNTTSPRTAAAYFNSLRFNPYAKPNPLNGMAPPPVSMPFSPYAAAMSALYAQRLPGSLPHP